MGEGDSGEEWIVGEGEEAVFQNWQAKKRLL
jgi:hypothetical protein